MDDSFKNPINEDQLAKKIGISRTALKGHRNRILDKDIHWKKAGRVIIYSEEGVSRLMDEVGVHTPKDELKATLREVSAKEGDTEELVFVRGGFANDRVIIAKRVNGELVTVRVRTSKNFRPADAKGQTMKFPAKREGSVWMIARPIPRWPGKW